MEQHEGPMTPEQLEAYRKTTEAIRERGAAFEDEAERLKAETAALEKHNREMEQQRREMEAHTERLLAHGARIKYQQEINSVAINVLVSILTKDALKSIKESEFSAAPKLDIAQTVDFSLMVAKRYIDELHKINVSTRQIEEYKDLCAMQPGGQPIVTPPPDGG